MSLLYPLVLAVTDFRLSGTSEDIPGVVVDKFGVRKVVVRVTNHVRTTHQDWQHPMAENVPQCG
jgi:hypothetical protein